MSRKFSKIVLASAIGSALAASTFAQGEGMYGQIRLAPSFGGDKFEVNNINGTTIKTSKDAGYKSDSMKPKTGFTGGIAFGYKDTNSIRYEGEFHYHSSKRKDVTVKRGATDIKFTEGKARVMALMANIYYDLDDMIDPMVSPYIGVGIGYANVKKSGTIKVGADAEKNKSVSKGVFGYQFIIGTAIHLMPELSATIDYRYFRTTQVKSGNNFRQKDGDAYAGDPVIADKAFQSHTINFGLVYRLG